MAFPFNHVIMLRFGRLISKRTHHSINVLCQRYVGTVPRLNPASNVHLFNQCRSNIGFLKFLNRGCRAYSSSPNERRFGNSKDHQKATLLYMISGAVVMLGVTYASVPLYRAFCQATGLGGQAVVDQGNKIVNMKPVENRELTVCFNADKAATMAWNFKPTQPAVKVRPGETALAFFTAKNPTDKPVIGISTYNIIPIEAGLYFNKIQCFCFDEQILNPGEEVDLPVFFYIDPEFCFDPHLVQSDTIILSYTFFEAKEGLKLPLPGFLTQKSEPSSS